MPKRPFPLAGRQDRHGTRTGRPGGEWRGKNGQDTGFIDVRSLLSKEGAAPRNKQKWSKGAQSGFDPAIRASEGNSLPIAAMGTKKDDSSRLPFRACFTFPDEGVYRILAHSRAIFTCGFANTDQNHKRPKRKKRIRCSAQSGQTPWPDLATRPCFIASHCLKQAM